MFFTFYLQELKYRLRSRVTWITCAAMFIFWFFANLKLGYDPNLWGSGGEVFHNAPLVIYIFLAIKGFVGLIALPLLMADPLHRDLTTGTGSWFFALPINEQSYFWGRFFGSFTSLALVIVLASLSILLAPHVAVAMGMVEADRVLMFPVVYLLDGYVKILLPTLFLSSAIVFSMVVLTRKFAAALIATIVLFLGSIIAVQFSRYGYHNEWLQYINPTGFHAVHDSTLFWTVEQRNSAFIPFTGSLLFNRLIWVGFGLVLLIFTANQFSFTRYLAGREHIQKPRSDEYGEKAVFETFRPLKGLSGRSNVGLLYRRAGLEVSSILREPLIIALFALCAFWVLLNNFSWQTLQADSQLPVTAALIRSKKALWMLTFVALPFLVSTLLYRERTIGIDAIVDSTPAPDWILAGSKLLTLVLLTLLFPTLVMLGGIITQLVNSYYNFDIQLYLTDLYLIYFPYLLQIGLTAFAICVFVNDRIKGFAITILLLYFSIFGHESGFLQNEMFFQLYETSYAYSAFSGYGTQSAKLAWYNLYWLSFSGFLFFLALLLWIRGGNTMPDRLKSAKLRLKKQYALVGILLAGVFLLSTCVIVYNQNILNEYVTDGDKTARQADYETTYSKLTSAPRPIIEKAKLEVEIYPDQRRVDYSVAIQLQNSGADPIENLHLVTRENVDLINVEIDNNEINPFFVDPIHRHSSYHLSQPLLKGKKKWLKADGRLQYSGFSNGTMSRDLVSNGTLLIETLLPRFNYDPNREISIPIERRNQGLPERSPVPQYIADKTPLNITVILGTDADQVPLAPGRLVSKWESNGRNYVQFSLKTDEWGGRLPVLSGKYTALQRTWKKAPQNPVEINLYHHPEHGFNAKRIVDTAERALTFLTNVLGPCPYTDLRIVETSNAISDPITFQQLILIPEKVLWTADYRKDRLSDYADYIIARELAKVWWSQKLTSNKGGGADVMSEAIAEYFAHRMIANTYGAELLVKKYISRTTRSYFFFRAAQSDKETAVRSSTDDHGVIYSAKTALALHALAHIMGSQNLNRLLGDYYHDILGRDISVVANAERLYKYLLAKLPENDKALLVEYFTRIVDYDLSIENAQYNRIADGRYKISLKPGLFASDRNPGIGNTVPPKAVEIGIYTELGENGAPQLIHMEPIEWKREGSTIEIIVDRKPVYAVIDPFRVYLDSKPDNNRVRLYHERSDRLAVAGS